MGSIFIKDRNFVWGKNFTIYLIDLGLPWGEGDLGLEARRKRLKPVPHGAKKGQRLRSYRLSWFHDIESPRGPQLTRHNHGLGRPWSMEGRPQKVKTEKWLSSMTPNDPGFYFLRVLFSKATISHIRACEAVGGLWSQLGLVGPISEDRGKVVNSIKRYFWGQWLVVLLCGSFPSAQCPSQWPHQGRIKKVCPCSKGKPNLRASPQPPQCFE